MVDAVVIWPLEGSLRSQLILETSGDLLDGRCDASALMYVLFGWWADICRGVPDHFAALANDST